MRLREWPMIIECKQDFKSCMTLYSTWYLMALSYFGKYVELRHLFKLSDADLDGCTLLVHLTLVGLWRSQIVPRASRWDKMPSDEQGRRTSWLSRLMTLKRPVRRSVRTLPQYFSFFYCWAWITTHTSRSKWLVVPECRDGVFSAVWVLLLSAPFIPPLHYISNANVILFHFQNSFILHIGTLQTPCCFRAKVALFELEVYLLLDKRKLWFLW